MRYTPQIVKWQILSVTLSHRERASGLEAQKWPSTAAGREVGARHSSTEARRLLTVQASDRACNGLATDMSDAGTCHADRMNTPDSAVMCGGVREVRVMTPAG